MDHQRQLAPVALDYRIVLDINIVISIHGFTSLPNAEWLGAHVPFWLTLDMGQCASWNGPHSRIAADRTTYCLIHGLVSLKIV